jgi:hypothetical protein
VLKDRGEYGSVEGEFLISYICTFSFSNPDKTKFCKVLPTLRRSVKEALLLADFLMGIHGVFIFLLKAQKRCRSALKWGCQSAFPISNTARKLSANSIAFRPPLASEIAISDQKISRCSV